MIKKLVAGSVAVGATLLPLVSFAAISAASGTQMYTDLDTSITTVIVAALALILLSLGALLGLGFGVRHLRKYVTGRKF